MNYRCHRDTFTEEQFQRHLHSFWAMPSSWSEPDPEGGKSMLARVWAEGSTGAVSVLPVLAQYTHARQAGAWTLSLEELARLTGLDSKTVARGAKALERLGLATRSTALRFGKRTTVWALHPHLSAPMVEGRLDPAYFFFPSRLVYGGNWRRMSAVQRLLYLAVGGHARAFPERPEQNPLLGATLSPRVLRTDLERGYEWSGRVEDSATKQRTSAHLRLTVLSFRELAHSTGASESALHRAVNALKHPSLWPGTCNDSVVLRYMPIAVYPTRGGSLLYHLRDHVEHWPWGELNRELEDPRPQPMASAPARRSPSPEEFPDFEFPDFGR